MPYGTKQLKNTDNDKNGPYYGLQRGQLEKKNIFQKFFT